MAKRRKTAPVRRPRVVPLEEHSLLLRSAESLGRVIGALQRQLDDVSRRMGSGAGDFHVKVNGSIGTRAKTVRKRKTATRSSDRKRKRTTQ
jgi:hypothetical protein